MEWKISRLGGVVEGDEKKEIMRLTGSPDLYQHDGRRPYASVNFITSHDGFTLNDRSLQKLRRQRRNSQDGDNNNQSWNCGAEGRADDKKSGRCV
jgi:glycogen operon protein